MMMWRDEMSEAKFPALLREESGASLVELALILPLLIAMLFGVIDLGKMYFLSMEVANAAEAAAVYGSKNPTQTTYMQNVATKAAPDVGTLTTSASYGCECGSGTGFVANCTSTPTCSDNVVYRVTVTASASYTPLLPWWSVLKNASNPGTITISNTAVMRAYHG